MIKASPFLQSLASGSSPSSSSSSSSSPSSSSYSSSASSKTTSGSSVSKSDGKFDYEEWNSPQRFWLGRYKFEDAELEAVMVGTSHDLAMGVLVYQSHNRNVHAMLFQEDG